MTGYIKYRILLQEPVRIADDSSAKQGQAVTRRYIPGSTIRGHVINALVEKPYFNRIKKELFSDRVRFHNAYLTVGFGKDEEPRVLIPSPKGFYEDKSNTEGEKALQNVVIKGEFNEAYKRARLGTNVLIESRKEADGTDDLTMSYYSPKVTADTKIRLGEGRDQEVFRSTSIMAGYRYTGYIAMDNAGYPVPESGDCGEKESVLSEILLEAMRAPLRLGNARSFGLGNCRLEINEVMCPEEGIPYASYMMKADDGGEPEKDREKECYMMLLSDTCMRDAYGEYCGIDLPELEKALGIQELKIKFCATSVTDIRGFNRHYGGAIPSVPMYEKGSIFHFSYRGCIDKEHLDEVHRKGIGIRRNEGFGQILFMDRYESLKWKQKGRLQMAEDACTGMETAGSKEENDSVILLAAKAHYRNLIQAAIRKYVVSTPFPPMQTASQTGNILSIAAASRFQPNTAWEKINAYFENKIRKEEKDRSHSTDKRRHRGSGTFQAAVTEIRDTDLGKLLGSFADAENKIMGIPVKDLMTDEETKRVRIELLIALIRYQFKEEVKA